MAPRQSDPEDSPAQAPGQADRRAPQETDETTSHAADESTSQAADEHAPEGPDRESVPSLTARLIDLSGSVYGTILASSIVVALSYRHHDNPWVMIGALAVTEAVFTLAHAWSELLSAGHARGELPRLDDLVHALAHEWPVLQATWPALIALLLAGLGVFSANTGVNAAVAINAAILFLWGLVLARRQHVSTGRAIIAGAITCALGLVLVALKVLVH